MNRRDFIKWVGASGVTTAVAPQISSLHANPPGPGSSTKPNVLIVLCDQWRGSALNFGPNHDADVQTPHIQAFASQGIRLDRCYAAHPVCTANRSAILTGKHPTETGMIFNSRMLPPDIPCMPDVFNDAGYRSHYSGKWHMDGEGKGTTGTPAAGFIPKGWRRRGLQNWNGGFNQGHSYFNDSYMLDDDGTAIPVPTANPSGTLDEQMADYEPHRQVNIVNAYMADHVANHADQPFFIWLNFGPPHTPYHPVPDPFDNYVGSSLTMRPNYEGALSTSNIAGYYGNCEAVDYEFSRLLAQLDSLGIADDTIVIFTSDHGDMLGSHNYTAKNFPEDESWRVPFIARWANNFPVSASDSPFSSKDIMPTLLSLCGLEIPDSVSGIDKSELLQGNAFTDQPVFGQGNSTTNSAKGWRGVVKKIGGTTYKLVRRINTSNNTLSTTDLFDLDTDPYELTNRVADGSLSSIKAELESDIAQWQTEINDVYPGAPLPDAGFTYPDTPSSINLVNGKVPARLCRNDDGTMTLRVKSQSRVYFTLQESSGTLGSWVTVPGSTKHGNGNMLNFNVTVPTLLGIPLMFYRVIASESMVVADTEFVEGGNIAGATASDWTNGAPSSSNSGSIGMDIVNGTMDGILDGQMITQLGGTISISSGTASDRAIMGATKYTLVDGVFRRTNLSKQRIGNTTEASDAEFHIVGGLLDFSSSTGGDGLVFMGTNSILKVSGGIVDVSGCIISLHGTSAHTDTPIMQFEAAGAGQVTCQDLAFKLRSSDSAVQSGYINFQSGSTGTLTVTGTISNNNVNGLSFQDLWNAGRLRYMGANAGTFGDHFVVSGNTLSLA